jgi:hypothetical protein
MKPKQLGTGIQKEGKNCCNVKKVPWATHEATGRFMPSVFVTATGLHQTRDALESQWGTRSFSCHNCDIRHVTGANNNHFLMLVKAPF